MAALGIEVQQADRNGENTHSPGNFYRPRMDVAYITSAHIPLAVLSRMAQTNHRGGWEVV